MIYCLTGTVLKKTPDTVVLRCGGVGYAVHVPAPVTQQLPVPGQEATLYTELSVTENDVTLYGFASEAQRDCFKLLTGVSGVGPKAGLAILSVMSPEKVALAASADDHKAFTAANGVGPKLAKRIALELKDKVGRGLAEGAGFAAGAAAAPVTDAASQAVAALVALGYSGSEAAQAVARIDDTLPVQDIIKIALRGLSRA